MSSTRRLAVLCLLQLSVCVSFASAQSPNQPAGNQSADTVVARQGSAVVTLADVDAFAQKLEAKERPVFFDSPKRLETLISNLLVQKQLAAEAQKEGLDKDPAVQAQIRLASEDILGKARMDSVRAHLKQPDFAQLAQEEYIGHKEKYVNAGKLDVKHILISKDRHSDEDAKALADEVQKEAKAHPDQFDALIEKYSEDPSKPQNHGLMKDARSNRYIAAFSSAASALKVPGEISPVVKTKFGYHVLILVARTSDVPLKFDDVKTQIIDQLRTAYVEKSLGKYTDEIRNQKIDADANVVASLRGRYGAAPTPPEEDAAPPPNAQTPNK